MSREIELKLAIPADRVRQVVQLAWLRELASGPVKHEKLVTVYFDTAKFKLRGHGLALRVRHQSGKRLQTVKVIKKGAGGDFGRDEWEAEIDRDRPDLKLAKATALAPLTSKKLRRKLRAVFETSVERTSVPIQLDGTNLEVAVDHGQIRTGSKRELISEIEIELKRGNPTALAEIAQRLAGSMPTAYGARAKAERGYALSANRVDEAVGAAETVLAPHLSAAEAFRTIALACLDHAAANERAIRAGEAEGVHQMRVGLRRLRAALSVFKELLEGPETDTIKAELEWLTEQLGPARDLDVLLEESIDPLVETAPVAGISALRREVKARRRAGFAKARSAVESERYRAIGLRTALWIANGEWSKSEDPVIVSRRDRSATEFAAAVLTQRLEKILKKAAKVEALDPRGRHKLRIAAKKLRYACEFFATLFKQGPRRRRLSKMLKVLQSALGKLNDIEVHKRIGRDIARPDKHGQAKKALAMGFVSGREQEQIAPCVKAVTNTGDRLSKTKLFWQ
jgi:triphosphatase